MWLGFSLIITLHGLEIKLAQSSVPYNCQTIWFETLQNRRKWKVFFDGASHWVIVDVCICGNSDIVEASIPPSS